MNHICVHVQYCLLFNTYEQTKSYTELIKLYSFVGTADKNRNLTYASCN